MEKIKDHERIIVTISTFLVAFVMAIMIMIFWTERRYNQGYMEGAKNGRRDVIEAILITLSTEDEVTIQQGENSVTLVIATPETE